MSPRGETGGAGSGISIPSLPGLDVGIGGGLLVISPPLRSAASGSGGPAPRTGTPRVPVAQAGGGKRSRGGGGIFCLSM